MFTPLFDQTGGRRQIINVFDNKPKPRALHSVFNNTIVSPRFHGVYLHCHCFLLLLPCLLFTVALNNKAFSLFLLPSQLSTFASPFAMPPPRFQQVGLTEIDSQSPSISLVHRQLDRRHNSKIRTESIRAE